jgi:hypothetical protein
MADCVPEAHNTPSEPHYWEDSGSKSELLRVLSSDQTDDPRPTMRAWDDVAQHSFPRNNMHNSHPTRDIINGRGVYWAVRHTQLVTPEGYLNQDHPDALVVKARQFHPDAQSPQHRTFEHYDWLIIETAAPSHDTAEGWKELLQQACARINRCDNGSHDIYLICAVGLKYMAFYWDPGNVAANKNNNNTSQQLRLPVPGSDTTAFPSQLTPVPACSAHVPHLTAEGAADQFTIDISRVWSADPGQVDERGQAMRPLTALEAFFKHVRTGPLRYPFLEQL